LRCGGISLGSEALPGKPVFVGYPASFDFLFMYRFLMRFNPLPHTHIALNEAVEQGTLLCNMLAENLRKPGTKGKTR